MNCREFSHQNFFPILRSHKYSLLEMKLELFPPFYTYLRLGINVKCISIQWKKLIIDFITRRLPGLDIRQSVIGIIFPNSNEKIKNINLETKKKFSHFFLQSFHSFWLLKIRLKFLFKIESFNESESSYANLIKKCYRFFDEI